MRKISITILVLSILLLTACSSNESSSPQAIGTLESVPAEYAGKTNPLGAEAATEGANVFHANCEACHGTQGHGDGPAGQAIDPRPQNLAALQTVATDEYLFWRISEGKYGTSMVGWKGVLKEEQIWQVVAFLRTLK
ncbi:MAG: c-type cytochrome [Anaerolineales bacterium]|nr:c-type cytochrome [Anaerolineales bacterium]